MNRLRDKIALITGGATGIGRGVALAFADEGADVAVTFHNRQDEARSLADEIAAKGRRCLLVHVEATQEASVQAMATTVQQHFGRIDVFVSNAGIQRPQAITEMSVEDWDRMMNVHLRGAFLGCRAVAPLMMARAAAASS